MYVLDEPSIGLHQRDNDRLIATLHHLRDIGNSVIVVEHDQDMMRAADHLIDMGPGAGVHGGHIMAQRPPEIKSNPQSPTGRYCRELSLSQYQHNAPPPTLQTLRVIETSGNDTRHINVNFSVGLFTCVTGVSGSGKAPWSRIPCTRRCCPPALSFTRRTRPP